MLNAGYRWTARALLAVVCTATVASVLHAQETAIPTAQVPGVTRDNADESLKRVIAVEIDHLSLKEAIHIVAQSAGISISYSVDVFPATHVVSLASSAITVQGALENLLAGTGLEPVVMGTTRIALQPVRPVRTLSALQQGSATIAGLVTDSGTGAIITQAVVHVDGTQLTVRSNATGHYTFSGLAAGEYRVTARHVGYLSKTRVVTLTDSGAKTIDFLLNQPATTLNEVVTTALGDMRRYQVGNVIATINVDSIAPNAPVTSVTDLITGRAAGVEVVEQSGLVGGGEDIRIRGVSSLLLQGDPIIIVDGIRVDNTPGDQQFGVLQPYASPYRLNDLDLNQIESINILKGPAATTEYGTDGANGVIVITTKHGTSGKPQWTASASQSASTVPTSYPPVIWSWGHSTDGNATAFTGANGSGQPCLVGTSYNGGPGNGVMTQENGFCVIDSVTSFNPLNTTATTPYGVGPASSYDLSVGGGSDAWRYYFGGGTSNATGVYQLPDVFRADAIALGFPNSALRPNTEQQANLTANSTLAVSPAVDVQAGVHILQTFANQPSTGQLVFGETAALNDSVADYGYGYSGDPTTNQLEQASPLSQVLGELSSQSTAQWVGSTTVNWRPASWVSGSVTAGIDHETQASTEGELPQAALLINAFTDTSGGGSLFQQQGTHDVYTVTMRASATATLWRRVGVVTSVGGSYVDTRDAAVFAQASGLAASSYTIDGSASTRAQTSQAAVKSGGLYVAENFAYADRCYAPLGLRFDVASGYGAQVTGTQNPNLSLTCTILTGRTSLRLRGSYGISDQQPPFGANLATYFRTTGQAAGDPVTSTIFAFNNPGNSLVKPERDQEVEGGLDLGLWNNRIQVEFTAYNKRAHDLLWTQGLGWELQGNYTENVGNVRNEGLEGTVTLEMLETRPLMVGVTVNGSVNHNKLLTLAPDLLSTEINNNQYFAAGYPLFGFWANPIQYADKSGSGELDYNDFVAIQGNTGSNTVYAGSSSPIAAVSMAPTMGLWRNTVTVNAMFQYEGDYKVINSSCQQNISMFCMPHANQLGEPLWVQALEQAFTDSYSTGGNAYVDEYMDGTYVAFRELSVAISLPRGWTRALRVRDLSVVGAVRNLALWTRYPFGDPETGSGSITSNVASNTRGMNNDIRQQQLGTVPLTRMWTVRLNAGF